MLEQHLSEQGITIETFVHRNGSPCGQYWGYIVVQESGDEAISHGKASSGKGMPLDPFAHREHALEYALSLAESYHKKQNDSQDEDQDLWLDIGGEG